MSRKLNNLSIALSSALLCYGSAIQAQDLEMYQHRMSKVSPNILFILDNSNSMKKEDPNAVAPYDPTRTYSGDFDNDYVYFGIDGALPGSPVTQYKVLAEDNRCKASWDKLESDGIYADRFASRTVGGDRWVILKALSGDQRFLLECQSDSGVHGFGDGGSKTYANKKTTLENGQYSKWTTDPNAEVNWKLFPYFAVYSANYLNYKWAKETLAEDPASRTHYWPSDSRFATVSHVLEDLSKRISNPNFGLLTFTKEQGNSEVRVKMKQIAKNRETLLEEVALYRQEETYNPPDDERDFDSIWGNTTSERNRHSRSQLDSAQAWSPATRSTGHWMQLPVPENYKVVGVTTQGRANMAHWTQNYSIRTQDDAGNWSWLNNRQLFKANTNRNSKVTNYMDIPEGTVAIRIYPNSWSSYPSMRAGLVVQPATIDGINNTHLGDSLQLAGRYFLGKRAYTDSVDYVGANKLGTTDNGNRFTFDTPVAAECQPNHVILLTDGLPASDDEFVNLPRSLTSTITSDCKTDNNGSCLDEWADFLNQPHQLSINGTTQTIEPIRTSTMAFDAAAAEALLQKTAKKGGGKYYSADRPMQLEEALFDIFNSFYTESYMMAAPGNPQGTANRFQSSNVYLAPLFEPTTSLAWRGNLKRYKLQANADGTSEVVDTNGDKVFARDGRIRPGSSNLWSALGDNGVKLTNADGSPLNDGRRILEGGTASRLTDQFVQQSRRIQTDINGFGSSANHNFSEQLPEVVRAMENQMSKHGGNPENASKVIQWIRGIDVRDEDSDGDKTDSNHYMGAFLHSSPAMIRLSANIPAVEQSIVDGKGFGTVIVAGSTSGMLHFFNGNGRELVAYLPRRHYDNAYWHYNPRHAAEFAFGWDGQIGVLHDDQNRNSLVDQGEFARVIAGEGRGGRQYTAFNIDNVFNNSITPLWNFPNKDDPTWSWMFEKMGQSWSKPQLVRLRFNGETKRLVLISGGYAKTMDSTWAPYNRGNLVVLLDAETGKPFWWAGTNTDGHQPHLSVPEMDFPIPATPTPVDTDGDGTMDIMFVGDTAGRIFRFDFTDTAMDEDGNGVPTVGSQQETIAQAGVILDTPRIVSTTDLKKRMFFQQIRVMSRMVGKQVELDLVVGSGHKGDPLSPETNDAIIMMREYDVLDWPLSYDTIKPGKLYDLKNAMNGGGNSTDESLKVNGWIYKLDDDEKVMTDAVVVNGKFAVSTFTPARDNSDDPCGESIGNTRNYLMDVATGDPAMENGNYYQEIEGGGVPPGNTLSMKIPASNDDGTTDDGADEQDKCAVAHIANLSKSIEECVGEQQEQVYWSRRILPD